MTTESAVLLALLLLALPSCDGAPPDSTSDPHLDRLTTLEAHEDARIGNLHDPDTGFTRIGGVDVDADGRLYVLEGAVPEIRVYSPEGELLRRMGRRGRGPGEFRAPRSFGVQGDTVWAVEWAPARIVLFDRSGDHLSTHRADDVAVPLPPAYGFVRPMFMRPDGRLTGHMVSYGIMGGGPSQVDLDSIAVPVVLFAATGEVVDTAGWLDRPPPGLWRPPSERTDEQSRPRTIVVGGSRVRVPEPPLTLPRWRRLVDGILVVETSRPTGPEDAAFTVTRIDLGGDTVYHRTLHYRPARYSSTELDSIAARAARSGAGPVEVGPGSGPSAPPDDWQARARAIRGAMDYSDYRLPVGHAWASRDGALWLPLAGEPGEDVSWVVLDPHGGPVGRLTLSARARPVWHRGDTVWVVDRDELGVPWLVRYRIGD